MKVSTTTKRPKSNRCSAIFVLIVVCVVVVIVFVFVFIVALGINMGVCPARQQQVWFVMGLEVAFSWSWFEKNWHFVITNRYNSYHECDRKHGPP